MPQDGVPDKTHWVVSDPTDPPVEWSPRREEWKEFLVHPFLVNNQRSEPERKKTEELINTETRKDPKFSDLLKVLQDMTITPELREFARSPYPLGLWKQKPDCDFANVEKLSDFDGRPGLLRWIKKKLEGNERDAPVYSVPPGQAVFDQICINCHGPKADSKGLMAETISDMTGGTTRVANFRKGILGPMEEPGQNWQRVFSDIPLTSGGSNPVSAEDWAGRYMAFMALGGTARQIPQTVLYQVGLTPVVGVPRLGILIPGTPNMLQLARDMCKLVLPVDGGFGSMAVDRWFNKGAIQWHQGSHGENALVGVNGDAEFWAKLCHMGNRQVVRAVRASGHTLTIFPQDSFYWGTKESYPDHAPVMNQNGKVEYGLRPENIVPLCVEGPRCASALVADPCSACTGSDKVACESDKALGQTQGGIPFCPRELFAESAPGVRKHKFRGVANLDDPIKHYPDIEMWASRGAANAGLAVFLYLQDLANGKKPVPAYDKCEKLAE